MNEIFGLSMTHIMIGLLCVLAVAVGSIVWVLVKNRIMFIVGVRNIPRRRAQTTLIIIGLMLSTLIIATAFSIGDTSAYSITTQAYDRLQSVDEIVQAQTGDDESDPFEGGASVISAATIQEDRADEFVARINELDGTDGAISVVRWPVSIRNEAKQQDEPLVIMIGLDAEHLQGFESDLETVDGRRVSPADLGSDEIFANESATEELDVAPGDVLSVSSVGQRYELRVKDILKDRLLSGALLGITAGIVVPIDRAQEMSGRPNEVDLIAVSNNGGVRGGVEGSAEVTEQINEITAGSRFVANNTKEEFIEDAKDTSSEIVTFFVILGLFSIAAGMMLIFLIFVMLAAERKVEMGMMRAVGTRRSHLVQTFMSEGMVYNVGAAAIGCALGVLVSIVMVRVMASIFADFDVSIEFHVTPRSLVVSYAIGVVLTFLTVTFSSWRIGALNIVSAIRDVPDPEPLRERPPVRRVHSLIYWLIFKPRRLRDWGVGLGLMVLGAAQFALVFVLFLAAGAVYDDASVVRGVLGVLLGIAGGFAAVAGAGTLLVGLSRIFQTGALLIALGLPLMALGLMSDMMAPWAGGASLVILGAALTLVMTGFQPRAVFTTAGVVLLVYWLLSAGQRIPPALESDFEMFFLSGVTMVLAATFVLVYNADLMLHALTVVGGAFSTLVPSIKTAVAYPLANKFRTGMTIAMISLVMFALVMMSTINGNFRQIFGNEKALGGYDVRAEDNPGNPVDDLRAALRREVPDGPEADAAIAAVDRTEQANRATSEVAQFDGDDDDDDGSELDYELYSILGVSEGFMRNNELRLQSRAAGFESDRAVWDAMAENPNYAIIDAFAVDADGPGDANFAVEGLEPTDATFEPIRISVRDNSTGATRTLQIVGVLHTEGSGLFTGLHIPESTFDATFSRPESSVHWIRLQEGADAEEVAQGIERTLLFQGVQADSLEKIVEDFQAQIRGFLFLIQGFMGIGLLVGIAAVGVIAFRTVVERRQQIGMLRAIGYTRRAVALSFLMESGFTTLLGILSGIGLALLLAYQLMQSDEFIPGGVESFYIPWDQIAFFGAVAFVASLLMTIIPSRQAASIPIAEALRYE